MLRVLVVAMGNSDPQAMLRHELSLVRSAALYADQVQLMSARAELLLAKNDLLARAEGSQIWEVLEERPDLREKLAAVPDLTETLSQIATFVRSSGGLWRDEATELVLGKASSIVEIVPFTNTNNNLIDRLPKEDEAPAGRLFMDRLAALINDPTIHPLLDSQASKYARALSTATPNSITSGARRRSRRAELGAGMIARLPAFPQAPLNELLDVKDDFKAALVRYRSAVGQLEKILDADIGAADLDAELDAVWSDRVQPAVIALEEGFMEHSFVRELAKSTSTSVRSLVTQGAALYIALSTVGDLAAHISAAAAAAGVALQATGIAASQRLSAARAMTKEDYYYLYRLSKGIARDTH
jgi:hypothetical protein